jgi:hypothetical protein
MPLLNELRNKEIESESFCLPWDESNSTNVRAQSLIVVLGINLFSKQTEETHSLPEEELQLE